MSQHFLRCDLYGDSFSPALAEQRTGLLLSGKTEPGEVGLRGRYKGAPVPYGAASICTPDEELFDEKMDLLLDILTTHIGTLRDCGAENISLYHLYLHDGQCNHEFSPQVLGRIAALGIPFCITCDRSDE